MLPGACSVEPIGISKVTDQCLDLGLDLDLDRGLDRGLDHDLDLDLDRRIDQDGGTFSTWIWTRACPGATEIRRVFSNF